MRQQKAVKWVVMPLAVLFGLLYVSVFMAVAFFHFAPHFLKARVDKEIAAIKARGEPVTMADLAGSPIPDSENGAVIYESIFREMDQPQVAKDMETFQRIFPLPRLARDPKLHSEIQQALARNHHLISLVERAEAKSACRFSINWQDGPLATTFPHLRYLRRLAFFLAADSVMSSRRGDARETARALETGFAMVQSLRGQPHLVSQLVRKAEVSILTAALIDAARQGVLDVPTSQHLFGVLGDISLSRDMPAALQGERAMGYEYIVLMRTHPCGQAVLDPAKPDDYRKLRSQPPERISDFWATVRYADELFYLRTMRRWIRLASMPYRDMPSQDRKLASDPQFPKYALGSAISLSVYEPDAWTAGDTRIAGDQILLALIAYKDRFGAYPASLGGLRAKLGWKTPADPFSGKDFIYKLSGKGFILYSVGPNLKDDGGLTLEKPATSPDDKYDIVWRMER